jgi:6-phosphogluconolactonase
MGIELMTPPANAPYARITQTLAQILTSRHIVLPLVGSDKLNTLQQAWKQANPALPISFVLQQTQTPVALWLAN